MTATETGVKERIVAELNQLPEEALREVAMFVEYQRYKINQEQEDPPHKPIALGGLWKGVKITEEDIAEARKEMWGNFGDREV